MKPLQPKALEIFIGRWKTEGQQHAGLAGPASKVSAIETYEWVKGGFFVFHSFDGTVGRADASYVEMLGLDPATNRYPIRTYYVSGVVNDWQYVSVDARTWRREGSFEMGGSKRYVRCTVTFEASLRAMSCVWALSDDTAQWAPFWEVSSQKLG